MEIPQGTLNEINRQPRCACVLLLDTSASMTVNPSGGRVRPIDELNSRLPDLRTQLEDDTIARLAVELAVVAFGGRPQLVQDWAPVSGFTPQTLHADGGTPLGEALQMGLDLVEQRTALYRQSGL